MNRDGKSRWMLRRGAQRSFAVAAWIWVASVPIGIAIGIVFSNDAALQYLNSLRAARAIVLTAIPIGTTVLVAGGYLWLGMLSFFFTLDDRRFLSTLVWFLALLLANSWAAALYYFTVYRRVADPFGQRAKAGADAPTQHLP